ncbi:MAG: zinc-dependent metalloprotease [Bacteroidota bacterium]
MPIDSADLTFVLQPVNSDSIEIRSFCAPIDCKQYNADQESPDRENPLCLELAIETDFNLYDNFIQDFYEFADDPSRDNDELRRTEFTSWIEKSFINPLAEFYKDYGIDIKLIFLNLYQDQSEDPYLPIGDNPSASATIDAFRDEWSFSDNYTDINRDLTIFITGRNMGGIEGVTPDGGVAISSVNSLCGRPIGSTGNANTERYNQFTHAITEGTNGQGWSTIAHEIGHILGLRHNCDCNSMMYSNEDNNCSASDFNCGGEGSCFSTSQNQRIFCNFLNGSGRKELATVDYPPGTTDGPLGADNIWCLLDSPPGTFDNGLFIQTDAEVGVTCEGDDITFSIANSSNSDEAEWEFSDNINPTSGTTGEQVTAMVTGSGLATYSASFIYNRQLVTYTGSVYVGEPERVGAPLITQNPAPFGNPTYNIGFLPAAGASSYDYNYTITLPNGAIFSASGSTEDPSIILENLPEGTCIDLTVNSVNTCGSSESQYNFCLGADTPAQDNEVENRTLNTEPIDYKINPPTLYPNPVDANLNLKIYEDVEFKLYDLTGKLVMEKKFIKGGIYKISVNHLSNGLYEAVMSNESATFTQKILIQHD